MLKKSKDNNGEPTSDLARHCKRAKTHIVAVILLTFIAAGYLLIFSPCETVVALGIPMENTQVSTYDTPQGTSPDAPLTTPLNSCITTVDLMQVSAAQATFAKAVATAQTSKTPEVSEVDAAPSDVKPSIYNPKVPLSSELQQYLYDLCEQRNLDYRMALAIIRHESSFNAKALGGGCNYGLFQINICHHKSLSATLKTANKPYDPKVNMNWGTYLLSCIYAKYSASYTGEDLTKAVLSAYNMGTGGFEKYGYAKTYIKEYYKALAVVNSWFE